MPGRVRQIFLGHRRECIHSCLHVIGRLLVGETPILASIYVGLAQYGTVLMQWFVLHSHERRLAVSMIDDEFEVCFKFLLSVVLAQRRLLGVPVRVYLPVNIPGAQKKSNIKNTCSYVCGGVYAILK
jgi:hypothetical protein